MIITNETNKTRRKKNVKKQRNKNALEWTVMCFVLKYIVTIVKLSTRKTEKQCTNCMWYANGTKKTIASDGYDYIAPEMSSVTLNLH